MTAPAMPPVTSYSGADWVERQLPYWYAADRSGPAMSPLGRDAADILGFVFQGIYHLPERRLAKVNWAHPKYIRILISQELATYDGPELTMLVLAAHARRCRVTITPHTFRDLALMIHARDRRDGGSMWERHPTIAQAIERFADLIATVEEVPR